MTASASNETGPHSDRGDAAEFTRLYAEHGRAVLAYALPRAAGVEDAADIVAETFLVAWRRAGEVPAGAEARFWLFGVARRTLANQQRGERRRTRLAERLRAELRAAVPTVSEPDAGAAAIRCALGRLGEDDRELLLLAGREELKSPEIGQVLGISAVAARTRLRRARRRLRAELAAEGAAAMPSINGLGIEEGR